MLHISVVLSSEMLQLKNRTRLMLQMNWEENTRGIKTTPKKEIWNIQQSTFIDFFLVRWVIWTDYCSLGFLLYRKSSSVYFLELYNTHWQVIYYYNGDKLPVFLWKKKPTCWYKIILFFTKTIILILYDGTVYHMPEN